MITRIEIAPSAMPSSGEMTMNMAALRKNARSSDDVPALTIAAPAKPPKRACDDDVGSASHQVMRSQTMAPISAAPTRVRDTTWGSTPLAIPEATFVSKTLKAMKLKTAAHTTAARGERTRVETTVAMELAAS